VYTRYYGKQVDVLGDAPWTNWQTRYGWKRGSHIGCPVCSKYVSGTGAVIEDHRGYILMISDYQRVYLWTHYVDNNAPHAGKKMGKHLVAESKNGIAGLDEFLDRPVLGTAAAPGVFVDWTVALAANQYLSATDGSVPAAIRKKYAYAANHLKDYHVHSHTCTLGAQVIRILCKQAADHLKIQHQTGAADKKLEVILEDKAGAGGTYAPLDFGKILVHAVRVKVSSKFLSADKIDPDGGYGGPGKKYVVPGKFGTDYKWVIIVVTEISGTSGANATIHRYGAKFQLK
jgi:hypothetical protein